VWFRKFSEFILFSSLFIAFCAVGFSIETNILLGLPLNPPGFYCFVFGATLVQYNLHYVSKKEAVKDSIRFAWSQKNQSIHYLLLFAGIILVLISFLSFNLRHFYILIFLGAIALLYSFPLIPFGKKRRLKEFGILKIFTLSLLWTLVTVWFPVENMADHRAFFWLVFAERFVFMFVLCLLFDIRDHKIDTLKGIRTIPVYISIKRSYTLSYLLLILFYVICVFHYFLLPQNGFIPAMTVSVIATYLIIKISQKNASDIVYLSGVDGMMLLQAILVILLV